MAQVPVEMIEVSGGYFGFGGDDFEGLQAGPRGRLTLLLGLGSPVSLGITGTYGRGGIEGADPSYTEWGLGGTGRATFGAPGATALYASLYAGWTRLSVDLGAPFPAVEENGFAIGPSLGVRIPVGSLALTVGGEVRYQSMGDFRLSGPGAGPNLGGGGTKGWRFGAEVGLILLGAS